jgi:quinol monooxygenase YgiN
MYVRLTYCKFSPEAVNEAKKIYMKDIVPAIRNQAGLLNIHFLEPTDKSDDFISITEWKTQAEANAYEASGLYKKLVGKLADFLSKPPVLKTYTTEETRVPAH